MPDIEDQIAEIKRMNPWLKSQWAQKLIQVYSMIIKEWYSQYLNSNQTENEPYDPIAMEETIWSQK